MTTPSLFRQVCRERGDNTAMREKDLGLWQEISWRQYHDNAKAVGLGLAALGFQRGDVTCVISENNPEWLYADMGTQGLGGICSGIYTTDSAKQLQYLMNDCRCRALFVENDEQLDKGLACREEVPTLKTIIIMDNEGLEDFRDPMCLTIEELMAKGREFDRANPGYWDAAIDKTAPEDTAILIYTSGTTGPPKGAMITHRNILFQAFNGMRMVPYEQGEQQLSFLPLAHIAERGFTTFFPLASNSVVNFAESIDTVPQDIREVQPTIFFAVPRIWEKFFSGIAIAIKEADPIQRRIYQLCLGIGFKMMEHKLEQTEPPLWLALAFKVADVMVLANLKRMIGVSRAKFMGTGAAPISPDLIRWYLALGCPMYEVYGQTENVGLATAMPYDQMKPGTVGIAAPDTEVKLSPQGEILLKGPHVFKGYLNQPEKTAETVVDGWLHTGDVGAIDNEGFVKITDRMKDIIITAGGKNITPSEIENQLKFSPFISDAVVIGDKRKFLSCLVMIDHDNVVKFAQDQNVPFTNYASLTRAKEVQDLIWSEIEKVNKQFARVETIKKFRLIDQLLTPEDDELTPTMKLKRKFVNQKYKELIDGMYVDA
ncbi:MAG: long-chain fatty acid--CoA ligase [Alphaproteobacteria bacterium]|nr:long-chain fatty acid--CoA ligase [Alphaproteobacteria bacterium]